MRLNLRMKQKLTIKERLIKSGEVDVCPYCEKVYIKKGLKMHIIACEKNPNRKEWDKLGGYWKR